jgi:hypothetical protein
MVESLAATMARNPATADTFEAVRDPIDTVVIAGERITASQLTKILGAVRFKEVCIGSNLAIFVSFKV